VIALLRSIRLAFAARSKHRVLLSLKSSQDGQLARATPSVRQRPSEPPLSARRDGYCASGAAASTAASGRGETARPSWKQHSASGRHGAVLLAVAGLHLRRLLTLEEGKAIRDARAERGAAECDNRAPLRGRMPAAVGCLYPSATAATLLRSVREPVGVGARHPVEVPAGDPCSEARARAGVRGGRVEAGRGCLRLGGAVGHGADGRGAAAGILNLITGSEASIGDALIDIPPRRRGWCSPATSQRRSGSCADAGRGRPR